MSSRTYSHKEIRSALRKLSQEPTDETLIMTQNLISRYAEEENTLVLLVNEIQSHFKAAQKEYHSGKLDERKYWDVLKLIESFFNPKQHQRILPASLDQNTLHSEILAELNNYLDDRVQKILQHWIFIGQSDEKNRNLHRSYRYRKNFKK